MRKTIEEHEKLKSAKIQQELLKIFKRTTCSLALEYFIKNLDTQINLLHASDLNELVNQIKICFFKFYGFDIILENVVLPHTDQNLTDIPFRHFYTHFAVHACRIYIPKIFENFIILVLIQAVNTDPKNSCRSSARKSVWFIFLKT